MSLFVRAKQLAEAGKTHAEIRAELERDGVAPTDISVVLGSLDPAAQPRPVSKGRFALSPTVERAVFLIAVLGLIGLVSLVVRFFRAIAAGFH